MHSTRDDLRVFYDGACPRCRRFAARHAQAPGITLVDLEAGAVELDTAGISREEALRRIHALDPDGQVLRGIDAVAAVWRRRPSLCWLAGLVSLPGVHTLAAHLYEAVATRRERDGDQA